MKESGLSPLVYQEKAVSAWAKEDVRDWLNANGFHRWSNHIAINHKVSFLVIELANIKKSFFWKNLLNFKETLNF